MTLNPEPDVSTERGINVMQAVRFSKMTLWHHPGPPEKDQLRPTTAHAPRGAAPTLNILGPSQLLFSVGGLVISSGPPNILELSS